MLCCVGLLCVERQTSASPRHTVGLSALCCVVLCYLELRCVAVRCAAIRCVGLRCVALLRGGMLCCVVFVYV